MAPPSASIAPKPHHLPSILCGWCIFYFFFPEEHQENQEVLLGLDAAGDTLLAASQKPLEVFFFSSPFLFLPTIRHVHSASGVKHKQHTATLAPPPPLLSLPSRSVHWKSKHNWAAPLAPGSTRWCPRSFIHPFMWACHSSKCKKKMEWVFAYVCVCVCVCIWLAVCDSHLLTNLSARSVSTIISSSNSLMANLVIRQTVHTADWPPHLDEWISRVSVGRVALRGDRPHRRLQLGS